MKSTKFTQFLSSLILIAACAIESYACGPYNPIIPTPEFLGLTGPHKNMSEYERKENLRLWQYSNGGSLCYGSRRHSTRICQSEMEL